jgi:hypothetical protein
MRTASPPPRALASHHKPLVRDPLDLFRAFPRFRHRMHREDRLGRIALLLLVVPGVVGAQAPEYRRSPGDTVRYREVTNARVELALPHGPAAITTLHEADLALAFRGRDTALAWYDSLILAQAGPRGNDLPSTDELIGLQFLLHFPPSGLVRTIRTPEFPRYISDMTDLTQQFDDFFISLPRRRLVPGLEWADTLLRTSAGRPQDTFRGERVRSYRARGDTVVAGRRGVVIEVRQAMQVLTTSRLDDTTTVSTTLAGEESGVAVFAVGEGRMLARSRTGRLAGQLVIAAGRGNMEVPQTYEYSSSIERR